MNPLRRLSEDRGFTLMELVVAMALGIVVLLAAFTVIDRSFIGTKTIADREDALQRGRNALEQFTRQLRSRVCAGGASITSATASSITFFTYLGDPTSGNVTPEQHTISFSGSTITESDYKVTSTSPSVVVAASPYRTFKVTNVAQAIDPTTNQAIPYLQYWQYDTSQPGTGALTALTSLPLSTADLATVADIRVSYVVRPTGINTTQAQSTTFTDDAVWRAPDPDTPTTLPCSAS